MSLENDDNDEDISDIALNNLNLNVLNPLK